MRSKNNQVATVLASSGDDLAGGITDDAPLQHLAWRISQHGQRRREGLLGFLAVVLLNDIRAQHCLGPDGRNRQMHIDQDNVWRRPEHAGMLQHIAECAQGAVRAIDGNEYFHGFPSLVAKLLGTACDFQASQLLIFRNRMPIATRADLSSGKRSAILIGQGGKVGADPRRICTHITAADT